MEGKSIDFANECCTINPEEQKYSGALVVKPTMTREEAEAILKGLEMIKQIDETGVFEKLGTTVDYQEMQNAFNDATIVILNDELEAAEDEITELTMSVLDGIEEREHLRADIQRLTDINQRQAQHIKEGMAIITEAESLIKRLMTVIDAIQGTKLPGSVIVTKNTLQPLINVVNNYIEDDNENLRALQAEPVTKSVPVEAQDFSIFNFDYKPGDCVTVSHFTDLSWNGVYKMGDDRVFRKVENA